MGATAPVAPSHSAGSILSRRPSGKAVLHWAGGRPFGGRPPAQCKTQNTLSGLATAERYRMQELTRVPLHLPLHLLPKDRPLTAQDAYKTATK
ncbi:hypothetical protein NDU88_002937 [Pleurodeles waltl]|uniref:Uncharacterized protein n=1 Tax=Pleurodeles waltl TaxID=8319 RepID=A0AAV7LK69_PLEWA|nr:hypothetical protein NDU88_002937 [Pleurodeles waltl]